MCNPKERSEQKKCLCSTLKSGFHLKEHTKKHIIMCGQTYFYLFLRKAQQVATQQGLMRRMNTAFTCTALAFKTGTLRLKIGESLT